MLDSVVVDFGGVVHRATLPESLASLPDVQSRWAPVVSNVLLLAAALTLAAALAGLVRARRAGARGLADEALVVIGLLLLGLNAVRVARSWPWIITTLNGLLAASLAVAAVRAVLARQTWPSRIWSACLPAALMLPHLHRIAFELADGRAEEGGLVACLRELGDSLIVVAFAATIFLRRPSWKVDAAAGAAAALVLVALVRDFDAVRDVLSSSTGLWLTTLPRTTLVVLLVTATFSVARLFLGDLVRDARVGRATAVVLWLMAGFLPIRPEKMLLAFLATVLFCYAAEGKADRRRDLPDLLF